MRTRTPRLPSHAGLAPHPSSEAHMLSHKHKHKPKPKPKNTHTHAVRT